MSDPTASDSPQQAASASSSGTPPSTGLRVLAAIGPAIITASVVLGPGSILSSSKVGHQFAYQLVWVLIGAALLMVGMTALSARLGVTLQGTLCDELARRLGRPAAALAGVTVFLIASCFQFGNNLGVLAALEPFTASDSVWPIGLIVLMNLFIIVALFGLRSLYTPVEWLMKLLVGLMLIGFAGNLLLAQPDVLGILSGLVPRLPEGVELTLLPRWDPEDRTVVEPLLPVIALVGTTFSVAGAFYQSYLVRQKGWTIKDVRQGFIDTAVGISVLALLTLMIMVTAAAVLHGNPDVGQLGSVADVARQLEPTFGGRWAQVLFCLGIFAGAFSSFMVNAMIGGSMLSDGLGLGGYIDQRWPKIFTVVALLMGLVVAVYVQQTGQRPVNLIIFAQAMTVLGLPILAAALLWLATRGDLAGERRIPAWLKVLAAVGFAVTLLLALRTATKLILPLIYGG